ncbi:MAG: 4Fe-4S binding protein [Desulfurivibrionaceae bacterium]
MADRPVKKQKIRRWRLLVQTGAFLLIIAAPLLNYYFRIDFIQGFYQSLSIGDLWFVSPLEGLESILTSKRLHLPLLIGMAVPVLLALFLGRVFCGWICPIHFLSYLSDKLVKGIGLKKTDKDHLILPHRLIWFALLLELLLTLILGAPIFVIFSPPALVGREMMRAVFFHVLALEGLVVVIVLLANLVTRRLFCRYFCPLGGFLAFLGIRRRLKISHPDPESCNNCGRCAQACPLGLNPARNEGSSPYCWNCGECVESCRSGSLHLGWAAKRPELNSQ